MRRFVQELTIENVEAWFLRHGGTDVGYLRTNFERYLGTYNFALPALRNGPAVILDVGAHWLHNAFFYANDGHKLICTDVPNTMNETNVRNAAAALGANLLSYRRLDLAESIVNLRENSIDVVFFTEILGHLAFNPIPMWQAIYRCMKPGGKVILTTPNAMYWRRIIPRIKALLSEGIFGISVPEIIDGGTYSHNWKDYSKHELEAYFTKLSSDFVVTRLHTWGHNPVDEADLKFLMKFTAKDLKTDVIDHYWDAEYLCKRILMQLEAAGADLLGNLLFMEIHIPSKDAGIEISPPWVPA